MNKSVERTKEIIEKAVLQLLLQGIRGTDAVIEKIAQALVVSRSKSLLTKNKRKKLMKQK